jgi:TRAP-type C4-dicarboxylate transport system permease small subunit
VNQLLIAVFGLTAIWLAMGNWAPGRKWAPVVGLCGQPFWFYFALQTGGWGILVLTGAYTAVYVRGVWVQWGPKA